MARTRIPTPHGPVFLHLYHNNKDNKEHLALVVDPTQLEDSSQTSTAPAIRSRSLDAEWSPNETTMERITRGAYVGRLSPNQHTPSIPPSVNTASTLTHRDAPPALVRIHSECFTGETIGSMRCDCGEQLDEAIRQISQPTIQPSSDSSTSRPTIIPGRGAIVYLRQEGRGIGLLSKIRAYNLQDLGHDTVTANILLGHGADERKYDIAGAILRDLGFGEGANGEAIRLLTNNPDKVQALEKEGLKVVERVPMVPKSWVIHQQRHDSVTIVQPGTEAAAAPGLSATYESSRTVHGPDLDKYLRTKVLRMGHLLPLIGHGA
jgi:GTP cyclohydrolase II